ncbi:MAG: sulfite exporter TauE/SafE family protein [Granulosicoccus sp.]|nr:sulfite exporter TauE/SafE family protein [Granulosicoccus sp.]
MIEPSVLTIVWCAFALFCGGLIKGTLGVGTPLLTVPMMALALPAQAAIALMAMPVVVANVWQALQAPRGHNAIKRQWPTALAILGGTWIGTRTLSTIDEKPLLLIVGIFVLCFTALQNSRYQFNLTATWVTFAGVLFGGMAGIIGGLSSMFGPMMIIYLMSVRDLSKNQFVSLISFLYLSAVIPWTVQLYLRGILTPQLLFYSALGVIPVVAGMFIGGKLRGNITESRFKSLILVVLLISGVTLIWRSFQ